MSTPSDRPHAATATSDPAASGPGHEPADLLLVRKALGGESGAVEQLLVRLSCVVRFVFRLNRTMGYGLPTEILEDVVQQVYVALWPRLSRYTGEAALESWAFGFCRNCLRAEMRRSSHRLRLVRPDGDAGAETEPDEGPAPDDHAARVERLEALRDALDRLEPGDRRIVELRHLEGWSFERIAAHTEVPVSTVKDRCYRALSRMKGRLRRRDVGA